MRKRLPVTFISSLRARAIQQPQYERASLLVSAYRPDDRHGAARNARIVRVSKSLVAELSSPRAEVGR